MLTRSAAKKDAGKKKEFQKKVDSGNESQKGGGDVVRENCKKKKLLNIT